MRCLLVGGLLAGTVSRDIETQPIPRSISVSAAEWISRATLAAELWNRKARGVNSSFALVYASGFFCAFLTMRSMVWMSVAMLPTLALWLYGKLWPPRFSLRGAASATRPSKGASGSTSVKTQSICTSPELGAVHSPDHRVGASRPGPQRRQT
jgi:hypothetical protein